MRRRDYELLSRTLAAARLNSAVEYVPLRDAVHQHYCAAIGAALKADNRAFDLGRFMADCGIEAWAQK